MTSTLCVRKTPKPTKDEWHFKQPIKGILARRFYDHDGSLGGGMITIGGEHLEWLEGVQAAGSFDARDTIDLNAIIDVLRNGGSIDLWFEV